MSLCPMKSAHTILALCALLAGWVLPAHGQGMIMVEERLIPISWDKPVIAINHGKLTYKPARPVFEKRTFGTSMGLTKVGVTKETVVVVPVAAAAVAEPAVEPAPAAAKPAPYKVGDMITVKGQQYRVDGIKDGQLTLWSPVFRRLIHVPATP
jgi:hypothetical protein